MRDNVRAFVQAAAQTFALPEPVLEIGSRPAEGQEGYAELRSFFPGRRYVGSDFLRGLGVDVLLDAHLLGLRDGQVGSVVMMDTLEHVQDPLLALREVHRALQPDGLVLLGSVMNFPIHNHPWDYWRFTPAAFDLLLRPFAARAVWYQGDPLAPPTVLAAARKAATLDGEVAFDAAVASLEANWPEDAPGGPLVRFEPLFDAVVRDRDRPAKEARALSPLVAGTRIEQVFVCPRDFLTRIDTMYRTHGRMNFCDVDFRLREEETGKVVAEGRYPAQHLIDGVWAPFSFSPVPDSAGRVYRLVLSSWNGKEGVAVSPLLSDAAGGGSEALYENGRCLAATLCFRALCLAPGYRPSDYRGLAGMTAPVAAEATDSNALLRRIALTQAEQLWQVAARVEERLDRTDARIDALERDVLPALAADVQDILLFVRSLRSSAVYKVLRGARGLFRRREDGA